MKQITGIADTVATQATCGQEDVLTKRITVRWKGDAAQEHTMGCNLKALKYLIRFFLVKLYFIKT